MYPNFPNQKILKNKFQELININNNQKRGYKFEELLFDMLRFYGLDPKKDSNKTKSGDQIDIIANFEGKQLIIEARYRKKPTDLDAIRSLNSKLDIRPPNTIGIYFSMSGFTEKAENYVSNILKKRMIILIDNIEIEDLIENQTLDFEKLIREKIFIQTKDSKVAKNPSNIKESYKPSISDGLNIIINHNDVDFISTEFRGMDCIIFSPIYYGFSKLNFFIEFYGLRCDFNYLLCLFSRFREIIISSPRMLERSLE